jgi:2'-hydroxyisoflavone reductase
VNEETYGGLKALCESEVHRHFAGRALIFRAGLIVGPHDYTDRFTYWVRRVSEGGEVLAPAPPETPVQLIDAGDLADWLVRMMESRSSGTFNVTGPGEPLTMAKVLETCREVSGSDAHLTWVDPGFLLAAGVEPWTDIPLWLPGPEFVGFMTRRVGRALSSGLEFRPLTETVRRTLEWDSSRPPDQPLTAGLTLQRESDLLAAWRNRE